MENIVRPNEVDFDKFVYDEPIVSEDDKSDKYIVVKIWYDFSDRRKTESPETLFIKNPSMPLLETSRNELVFGLESSDQLAHFYEQCDQYSINHLKTSGLLRQYKLKDLTYKTIVNETDGPLNYLRFTMTNGKQSTHVYTMDKKIVSHEQQNKLLVKDAHVMSIVEPDAIVIDLQNKTIFTNIVTRQVLITKQKQTKPHKVVLTEFSFVDSDANLQMLSQTSPKKNKTKKVTRFEKVVSSSSSDDTEVISLSSSSQSNASEKSND